MTSVQLKSPAETMFLQMITAARQPVVADRFANGLLPLRAARHCDAVTMASSFGWWFFPPMDFTLLWDGRAIFWRYQDKSWMPLTAVQFPGFAATFDEAAPGDLAGYSPPFLTVVPEAGVVQIWTGFLAKTAPDWSVLVRAPANLPSDGGYELFEGIVEADRWHGPLFTNIKLARTHTDIHFSSDRPLIQVQPLHRSVYSSATLSAFSVRDLAGFSDEQWEDFRRDTVLPSQDVHRPTGSYAAAARRRRRQEGCPFTSRPVRSLLSAS